MVNILIFRTDRIGDLLATCPTIVTIKDYFKNCSITLISSKKNTAYAKSLNIFDSVLEFPNNSILSKINFIKKIRKKKFSYTFVFDGKERSILSASFIKSKFKVALTPKIKIYYRAFNIKYFEDSVSTSLNDIFQKALIYCQIDAKITNYNFLMSKKDNNFSDKISMKNYVHIHLDEKWFNNLYIKSYKNINPNSDDFIDFINSIARKDNILITTGLVEFGLIRHLNSNFFNKVSNKIYFKKNLNTSIYLINKPSFEDIESLLRNSKILISCHGAITHAANSFNVKIIDIIEENKKLIYKRFTAYLKKYSFVYRDNFDSIKETLHNKIYEQLI